VNHSGHVAPKPPRIMRETIHFAVVLCSRPEYMALGYASGISFCSRVRACRLNPEPGVAR
jgi:hypothetical protein